MGEYLVAYLTTKYGIRQLIMQSLTCILAAIEHFTPMDAEIALYGKILRNEVEEQFEAEQRALQVSIEAALQSALQVHIKLLHLHLLLACSTNALRQL